MDDFVVGQRVRTAADFNLPIRVPKGAVGVVQHVYADMLVVLFKELNYLITLPNMAVEPAD